MTEAWFTPETARLFSLLSLLALTAMVKPLAQQGRARAFVLALFSSCCVLGVVLFIAGIGAMMNGQPDYVRKALMLSGTVVAIPFFSAWRHAVRIYTDFELRKTIASDL